MKKIGCLVCVLCLMVVCTGCVVDREKTKQQVMDMVREKCDILLEDIAQRDLTDSEQIDGITRIRVVWEWPSSSWSCIEYECGGSGFGSSTSYWGFYYSEDDDMTRIWCADEPLVPHGNGFLYQEPDGDNRYYTEHIIDHFYYYEASY